MILLEDVYLSNNFTSSIKPSNFNKLLMNGFAKNLSYGIKGFSLDDVIDQNNNAISLLSKENKDVSLSEGFFTKEYSLYKIKLRSLDEACYRLDNTFKEKGFKPIMIEEAEKLYEKDNDTFMALMFSMADYANRNFGYNYKNKNAGYGFFYLKEFIDKRAFFVMYTNLEKKMFNSIGIGYYNKDTDKYSFGIIDGKYLV